MLSSTAMRCTTTAVLLILPLCLIVNGIPVAEEHRLVKRTTAAEKIIMFVSSNFSMCIGNCSSPPAGVQTRSRTCRDQDGIRYPICGGSVTENCCIVDLSFFTDLVVACNPGCPSNDPPVFPIGPSFVTVNGDMSVSTTEITENGDVVFVSTMTIETDNGQTVVNQSMRGGRTNFSMSIMNPQPDLFSSQIQLGGGPPAVSFRIQQGADVTDITIPSSGNVVRTTVANDSVDYVSNTVSMSNPASSITITEGANTFYYISPLGITYEFSENKVTAEMGEGLLFVNSDSTVAIFSQYQAASDQLTGGSVNGYSISTNNGMLRYGIGDGMSVLASSITESSTSGEVIEVSGPSLTYVFGSTGFEAYSSDPDVPAVTGTETYVSGYDAVFRDNSSGITIISTNSRFSRILRQGSGFASDSNNNVVGGMFVVDGEDITYQGAEVLKLSSATQTFDISSSDSLIYTNNRLIRSDGSTLASGVMELFAQGLFNINNGQLGRALSQISLSAGSVVYVDDEGKAVVLDAQFNDSIAFFNSALNAAINPVFPTATPSAMFSLRRDGSNVFLQVDSMDVLNAVLPTCLSPDIDAATVVSYDNGVLRLTSNGNVVTITGVNMLTVAANGENTVLLTSSTTGFSTNVDASYTLRVCPDKAVLTNIDSVTMLIDSAPSLASAGVVNGDRSFFVGSMEIIPLNADTRVIALDVNDTARVRSNVLTVRDDGSPIAVVNGVNSILRYLTTDSAPVTDSDGLIDNTNGVIYYEEGETISFFTDRSDVNQALANELAVGFNIGTNSAGQTVLSEDGSEVIILNGVTVTSVAGDQSLRYTPSTNRLELLDSSGNAVQSFNNVGDVSTFLLGGPADTQTLQSPITIDGPLTLFSEARSGDYFATDNPLLLADLNAAIPVASLAISAVDGGNNNVQLTIGSLMLALGDSQPISSSDTIQYSGSTLTVGSQTIPGVDTFYTYLSTDAMPQANSGSGPAVSGPGRLYTDGNIALFSDRQDVLDAFNSITPVPPPAVSTRVEANGRVVLVIGSQDIIAVNERPMISIPSASRVEFDGSRINIIDSSSGNTVSTISDINSFTSYIMSDMIPETTTDPVTILEANTPGTLVIDGSGNAFYTSRSDVQDELNRGFSLLAMVGPNNELVVGGDDVIELEGSARVNVADGEQVMISGSTITVTDSSTNDVVRTFINNNDITRYLSSDSTPVSDPGDSVISGPVTLVADVDNGTALITNRPEVISAINMVLGGGTIIPSLPIDTRQGVNDTTVLTINMRDIVTIDGGITRELSNVEEVNFTSNVAAVMNFISGEESDRFTTSQVIRYLSTDGSPVTFDTGSGPIIMGPGTLFYQPNVAPSTVFITDRMDVIIFLMEAVNNVTLSATPPTGTPQPGTTISPPEEVMIVNEDGTFWEVSSFTECSRTCGAGVRVRNVVCRDVNGDPSTVCNQPRQRTANAIPAVTELCNTEDCPGEPRNGVPRNEIVSFSTLDPELKAVVKITDSNITEEYYTIDTRLVDKRTSSLVEEKIENIDGVQSREDVFMLRTETMQQMTGVMRGDMRFSIQVDGETLFMVNPVPRDSFPGDQCFELTSTTPVTFQDRMVNFNSGAAVFDNILVLISQEGVMFSAGTVPFIFTSAFEENLHSMDITTLFGRPSFTIMQPGVLCVSPQMQSAFIGGVSDQLQGFEDPGLIMNLLNEYNRIVDSLSLPSIMPSVSPPTDPITESGEVVQVGAPSVEVEEDIFYFSLRCQLSSPGNPPASQPTWWLNGAEVPNNNVKFSITGDTLLIKNINEADEGNYTCTVSNPLGSDEATTEVIVLPDMPPTQATVEPPTTPPPPPDWVPEPFSECSKECGVGIRVRAVVCRDSSGQQSQECEDGNVPQLAELCNIEDCPDGPAMNGVPAVNVTDFTRSIFNGDVDIRVAVTSSDPSTGDYSLTVTSNYPDETVIEQTVSKTGDDTMVTSDAMFGPEPLFGRVDSVRTGDRIDISHINLLYSVLPSIGDVCFNLSDNQQFIYSDNRVLFMDEVFEGTQFVLGVENEGVTSFQGSTNRVFTGPLTLCISPAQRRAFYTDIPSLAEDIITEFNDIINGFRAPMIMRINETDSTVVVDSILSTTLADIGQTIRAPAGAPLYITVRLSDSGNPAPTEVTWMFNGEPLEQNPDKGIFFTSGMYTLVINRLFMGIVGDYTATVMNPAGSDSVTTSVILQPQEGIIVQNRMPSAPTFNVGIGTSQNVDRSTFSSVDIFCDVATNETDVDIRFRIGDMDVPSSDPSFSRTSLTSAVLSQSLASANDSTIYTCIVMAGNMTFTELSVMNVMDISPPTAVQFTGETQLDVGESSTITCTAVGGVPQPETLFNEVRLGPDMIVSDFVFSDNQLMISEAVYGDDSRYCCEASNEAGSVEDCVTITLMIPPMITRPNTPSAVFVPISEDTVFPFESPLPTFMSMVGQMVTAPRGSVVVIRCDVSGSPEPQINWFVNGVQSMEAGIGENFTIEGVQFDDSGTYECRVSSPAGTDTLTTTLTVVAPPMVRSSSVDISELSVPDSVVTVEQPSDLFVLDGLDFCLRCDIEPGVPADTTIVWQRNGDNVNIRDACLSFAENRTQLCFEKITRPYSDRYSCVVSNIAGSDSGGIDLIVAEPPRIFLSDPAPNVCDHLMNVPFITREVGINVCLSPGARILIDCVVDGNPRPTPTVVWIFNETGQVLSSNDTGITIFANNSLLIDSIAGPEGVGGSGAYICRASNFAGSHERISVLRASGSPPVIERGMTGSPFQGDRFVTSVGSPRQTVTLQRFPEIQIRCNVIEGSPTPTVSWAVNGIDIRFDNDLFDIMEDGSLLITGLLGTECSEYVCTASNPLGQASESVVVCGELFNCEHTGFGECSQTCGVGIRQPTYSCNRTFNGMVSEINYEFILRSIRPETSAVNCETGVDCPQLSYRFVTSEFSECSKSCGCGRQSRTVECFTFFGEQQNDQVDFNLCRLRADNQTIPELSRICNDFSCPEWSFSDFSECSQECGYSGVQTREVFCIAPANGNRTVEDSLCDPNGRPSDSRNCNRFHCPYVYSFSPWTACSTTCRGGMRTRDVFCFNAETQQRINETLCERELGIASRPISSHICGVGNCPGKYTWLEGAFGQCNATCGTGVMTRSINCVMTTSNAVVDEAMCSPDRRPEENASCFLMPCPSGDCAGENPVCTLFSGMGLCSMVRPNCCLSCPS